MKPLTPLFLALLTTAACTVDVSTDDMMPGHTPGGGKADDGEAYCPNDAALIRAARLALMAEDPAVYAADSFTSEGRTEQLADLDGDGLYDLLVYPGIQYASTNEEMVVMHSDSETDCIRPHMVGHFIAATLVTALQGPEGGDRLNLETTSYGDCETVITTYAFDSIKYVAVDTMTDRSACDDEGAAY